MAQLYAMTTELSGKIKEETVCDYEQPVSENKNNPPLKKRPVYKTVVNISFISLAQKILSPLTRPVELTCISHELIDFIKLIASEFKLLNFPKWFSDPDKKKRVRLNIVFKDTLKMNPNWGYFPFTTLNVLSNSTRHISCFINDIFNAVFTKYASGVAIIATKNGLKEVEYANNLQQFILLQCK